MVDYLPIQFSFKMVRLERGDHTEQKSTTVLTAILEGALTVQGCVVKCKC